MKEKANKKNKKIYITISIIVLFVVSIIVAFSIPSPTGTNVITQWYDIQNMEVLFDSTYFDEEKPVRKQCILEEQINMINEAEEYIIIDVFLCNADYDKEKYTYPTSAQTFTSALINKKMENPNVDIVVITDPVNNFYGSYEQEFFKQMKEAQIDVIITDLTKLRDPNYIYSGLWRVCFSWMGQSGLTWIPNLKDKTQKNINIRSLLVGMNAKANHRKVLITDQEAMITSFNPHDASAYHSNVAFKFKSNVINELIQTEETVGNLSKYEGNKLKQEYIQTNSNIDSIGKMRILTEKQIYYALKQNIDNTQIGDTIYVCTFYLSDFDIIDSIIEASKRGVQVYIILDSNITALGTQLHGIPNRVAMNDMYKRSKGLINIRWYNSNETQYHTKMLMIKNSSNMNIIGGSANFTRRNIKGYNLETDVEIIVDVDSAISLQMQKYFSDLWDNNGGKYTVAFDTYKDNNWFKYWLYVFEESTGFGTF